MASLVMASLATNQVLVKAARKKHVFAMTSTTEYAVLPLESRLATSALIVSARKFVKKIRRQPFCIEIERHIIPQGQRRRQGDGAARATGGYFAFVGWECMVLFCGAAVDSWAP